MGKTVENSTVLDLRGT